MTAKSPLPLRDTLLHVAAAYCPHTNTGGWSYQIRYSSYLDHDYVCLMASDGISDASDINEVCLSGLCFGVKRMVTSLNLMGSRVTIVAHHPVAIASLKGIIGHWGLPAQAIVFREDESPLFICQDKAIQEMHTMQRHFLEMAC